ncbi:protein crowded nuclei 1 [Quercus suber]|uniref:Protein crowded nuclei 1 n=1 Tax=Quercus suber TaxID=58331 RepID=A0AAW0KHG1_QUESU
MFTPQKKAWSGWSSLTPRKSVLGSGQSPNSVDAGKGKTVAFVETTPNLENGGNILVDAAGDPELLAEKVSKLEIELFEYQYNMGLLLIEKKDWTSKYEELRQALAEAKDALKQEQSSHLIAISEVENREENLRKALGVEKECVLDLEKALRDMRSENAEIKFTADSKLAEASALVTSIEEKSFEVEAKLRAADAKLAEVSRKNSEIERKSQDLEAREAVLRRDRLSFISEREGYDSTFSKQREDLREWERKLQEGEDRLAKGQIMLNQREERANENDRIFKQKEKVLEEAQKKIEATNISLQKKEEDISIYFGQEFDVVRLNLETKEKELLALEEKLNARERTEIQKLLDEHNAILDAKKSEFDLEIDQKRKSVDDDLKNKVVEVEKREAEINHMEQKVAKREQTLEKRWEKLREKEKDHELKLKDLKEREKSLRSEEKNLENEKKQMLSDKEDLLSLKDEVEKIRAHNDEELLKIAEEKDQLKVSEEERLEFVRLQSELKQEIENCRLQKELILKEAEDLKLQKESFEREWEELDEKRAEIEKDLKKLTDQKEEMEKLKHSEEEKLKNEKLATQEYIQRELEDLKFSKESFTAQMEHDKLAIAEKADSDRSQMLHDFELRKRELETDLQNQLEYKEKDLRERERLFQEERERELNNINYLREVARREMEGIKLERAKIEKERQEADENRKHLERHQVEMRKDIDVLDDLRRKLKDQRDQFVNERRRFISFVEKLKGCENCAQIISEYELSDLQSLAEIENEEVIPLSRLDDVHAKEGGHGNVAASEKQNSEISPVGVGSRSPVSGGTISWLRKCTTKIFKFSPIKNIESTAVQNLEAHLSCQNVDMEEPSKRVSSTENQAEISLGVATDSFDVQRIQSDNSIREIEVSQDPSADDQSNINSKAPEVADDSQPSDLNAPGEKRYNLRRPKTKATVTAARAMPELSKENKEETDVVRATGEKILRSKAAPALSTGAASENGGSSHFLRSKRVADSQVGVADITNNLVENTIMSEEVNETPEEYGDVDEYRSESHGEDANVDGADEEDDEESEHPGEVSIGKKLWTFFTT